MVKIEVAQNGYVLYCNNLTTPEIYMTLDELFERLLLFFEGRCCHELLSVEIKPLEITVRRGTSLPQRIKALPAIKDDHGDECISREVVLAMISNHAT